MLPHLPRHDSAELRLVLLVDHDAETRLMYKEYLGLAAVEVEEATEGRDALAKAISLRPDVIIITETRLPGIDGYELVYLLRQDPATRSTPIVVVTGDGFEEDLERAWAVGADSVLVKPCLPEALLVEMRRLVRASAKPREPADAVRPRISASLLKSKPLQARARVARRQPLSRAFRRHDTTTPPEAPPVLVCPSCDQTLVYQRSHIGGVSERHREQWDYYDCPSTCGSFQYRQRTRTLRKISTSPR